MSISFNSLPRIDSNASFDDEAGSFKPMAPLKQKTKDRYESERPKWQDLIEAGRQDLRSSLMTSATLPSRLPSRTKSSKK